MIGMCTKRLWAVLFLISGYGCAGAGLSQSFTCDRPAEQGNVMVCQAAPGTVSVTLDGNAVPLSADGGFLLAFGRDAGPKAHVVTQAAGGGPPKHETLSILKRHYVVERISGLPPRTVTLSAADEERRKGEVARINAARAQIATDLTAWREPFQWPAKGRISGVYGSQRIRNGVPGSPHNGVDVAAPVGTPIVAPAAGIVRLAEPDMLLEGGLIILDHGAGLSSAFLHLSRIDVTPGQHVSRGETLGAIGSTGRATGPHLHWGMVWGAARLDPVKVGKLMLPAQ